MITQIISNQILQEAKHTEKKLATSDLILKLLKCGFKKESEIVKACGNTRVFSKQVHIITEEQRRRLKKADFCKFRFCNTCNWRRNLNIQKSLLEALEKLKENRNIDFIFLTLTVENPLIEDLKSTVEHMNKSFVRFQQTKAFRSAFLGFFKALEILGDKTKAGEAHPHFHIMLIVDKNYFKNKNYLGQHQLRLMWQKALKSSYLPQIRVEKIKPKKIVI